MLLCHSDHLGGANWITDGGGKPVQHLQYLPFGEPFVNQHIAGYQERYTFTGKERDEETGYGYFGARYMDHELMTMWLSVDPLADKYPSISPYAYCAWNPVKLVDPDGRDIWKIDNLGNIVDHTESNDFDQIHIMDDNGSIRASSCQYELGTLSELSLSGSDATAFSVCGTENANNLFMFLADNYTNDGGHPLEWGHASLAESADASNIIGTNHEEHSVHLISDLTDNSYSISEGSHNHPSGNPRPSGDPGLPGKDIGSAAEHERDHPGIKLYTYTPRTGYTRYNSNGCQDERMMNFWRTATWQGKK